LSARLTESERRLDSRIDEQFATMQELLKRGDRDHARSAWKVYVALKNRRTIDHQNKLSVALGLPIDPRAA
jgi:hypothetical protein